METGTISDTTNSINAEIVKIYKVNNYRILNQKRHEVNKYGCKSITY